jgi:crotonobetainyl-CoA:carnitine CoA-transferase CaiB-like acyl-CoA transferase
MDGIKVLDFTRLLPGPLATYILAHLGAEVIKIEDTGGSDFTRYSPPFVDGKSAVFSFLNAGKKSVSINLKTEKGKQIALELAKKVDVIVEGFRPGVMKKFGLDFDSVKILNKKIIYCSITGYGQTGNLAFKSGHDLNYISFSGIERMFISDEKGIAVIPQVQIADISSSLFAVIAILHALFERERYKENFSAKFIDISMVETSLFFAVESLSKFFATGIQPKPFGEILTGGVICYNIYRTRDGKWLSLGALEPKFWENVVKALGLDLLPSDAMTKPDEKENPAYKKLKDKIASMTSSEIEEAFSKYDIPYEFVRGYDEMVEDPHIKQRNIFYEIDMGGEGKGFKLLKLGFMKKVRNPAPELGEHTREILKRELSLEDKEIDELKKEGVIFAL